MDDYIALAITSSRSQLHHVANTKIKVIHNVFPLDNDDDKYAISLRIIFQSSALGYFLRV